MIDRDSYLNKLNRDGDQKLFKWSTSILAILFLLFILLNGCSSSMVSGDPTVIAVEPNAVTENQPVTFVLPEASLNTINSISDMERRIGQLLSTDDVTLINNATMAFIRKDRYGYNSGGKAAFAWNQFAGNLLIECGVNLKKAETVEQFRNVLAGTEMIQEFVEPVNNEALDFVHMVAVVDIGYTQVAEKDYQEVCYDSLFSWGGDLETFLIDMTAYSVQAKTDDEEKLYLYALKLLGSEEQSYFSKADFLADVDGLNIAHLMIREPKLLLSEAIRKYYESGEASERYSRFIEGYGGKDKFEALVFSFMTDSVAEQYKDEPGYADFMVKLKSMKVMMLGENSEYPKQASVSMRRAAAKAFVFKMFQ